MDGQRTELTIPGHSSTLGAIRYGHWGRPVLVFASAGGTAEEFAERGMVDAVGNLVESGRVSLFCVDSDGDDAQHTYTAWLEQAVLPWITEQLGGRHDIITVGVERGAYQAVHFSLTHAHQAPLAIGLSGGYDAAAWHGTDVATYLVNPTEYLAAMRGEQLDWLREHASVLLVTGPSAGLESAQSFAKLLGDKDIPHELDVWGEDVTDDWSWRQRQLAHHLPRFC